MGINTDTEIQVLDGKKNWSDPYTGSWRAGFYVDILFLSFFLLSSEVLHHYFLVIAPFVACI